MVIINNRLILRSDIGWENLKTYYAVWHVKRRTVGKLVAVPVVIKISNQFSRQASFSDWETINQTQIWSHIFISFCQVLHCLFNKHFFWKHCIIDWNQNTSSQCDFWAFLSSKQNSVIKYFSRQPNPGNLAISASSMSVNKV